MHWRSKHAWFILKNRGFFNGLNCFETPILFTRLKACCSFDRIAPGQRRTVPGMAGKDALDL